jgi:predicted Zn-dependent protease
MRRLAQRLAFICIFMLGLSGCAVNKADIRGFNLISIQQEKELGAKFAVEIEKQQKVLADSQVQAYVDRLGRRLLAGASQVEFDYTFKVVEDDSVNAFAIPGGHIYVHTGLIKAAQNEAELAGVMAHEINHAVARHGTRAMTQQYGYSLVMRLVLGENPGMLSQLAASLFGKAGQMSYSRGMEAQADYLAVSTMAKTGVNPQGLISFFEKLQGAEARAPGTVEKFFSSHPVTGDRIAEVKAEIANLPPRAWPAEDQAPFKAVKARLK